MLAFVSDGGLRWSVLCVAVMLQKMAIRPLIKAMKAYAYLFAEVWKYKFNVSMF